MTTPELGEGPVLVTGATGNVGREVVRALLSWGVPVRAAMHRVREPRDEASGVTPVSFDFEDSASYGAALRGVHAIFLMRPNPVFAVKKTLNRVIDAAADLGVKHCVFLSVAGAEKNRMVPHYAVEQHLMRGPMTWTLLRAGFFAQNLTGPYREDIRNGVIVLPAGEGRVAYVDAQDLGDVAAIALRDPVPHAGRAYHLTGADSLSFRQLAGLLTAVLGRPVTYAPASVWRFWSHCRRRGIGLVPTIAYTIIHASLRGGAGAAIDPTLSTLLGRPARTMLQFIEAHRLVWT